MRKRALLILALVVMCFAFTACKKEDSGKEAETTQGAEETTVAEGTEAESTEVESTEVESEEAIKDVDLSWEDNSVQFLLDGQKFNWPLACKDLLDSGWEFKFPEEILVTQLDSGVSIASEHLIKGDHDFEFLIGFRGINESDKNLLTELDILDWEVCDIMIDIMPQGTEIDNYPELVFPGNITWGSSADDCIAVLGEPVTVSHTDYSASGTVENPDYTYMYWVLELKNLAGELENCSLYVELYEDTGVFCIGIH